jgi:hypothetical protein
MCPEKDKETGMYSFNFNIEANLEEPDIVPNEGWKTWRCADWINVMEEIEISDAHGTCIQINNNEKEVDKQMKEFVIINKYESFYDSDSDDDEGKIISSYDYGNEDNYEFMIPEAYKGDEVHNMEMEITHEDVLNCEHEKDWKEEWLLDSGSTVNLTNQKERFWNQCKSSVYCDSWRRLSGGRAEGRTHCSRGEKFRKKHEDFSRLLSQLQEEHIKCKKTPNGGILCVI